jgi:hypothetical protein
VHNVSQYRFPASLGWVIGFVLPRYQRVDYIPSNGSVTDCNVLGSGRGLIEVLFWYLRGGTEEDYESQP